MADFSSEPSMFEGTDPKECEAFVASVRRRGLELGKHRDHEWMAVFTSSYLAGEALYWYEDLDEDVQNDWSRLRPALLARFGRRGKTPSVTSSTPTIPIPAPSTTIPTPAAAPPAAISRALVRKGYLKVLDYKGRVEGYISKSPDEKGQYETLSSVSGDRLLVSFTPSADTPFSIQILEGSQNFRAIDVLAIGWEGSIGGAWMKSPLNLASCCSLSIITAKSWAFEHEVWGISKDGELCVVYPKPDGGSEKLEPFKNDYKDLIWWARPPSHRPNPVRIFFEDAL